MIARSSANEPFGRGRGDRVFLDANVLFSAANRADSALKSLWSHGPAVTLLSSAFAIEEARRNLEHGDTHERLAALVAGLEIVPDVASGDVPSGVTLPAKDVPILLSAVAAGATHLLTGDRAHFGPYFGRRVADVLVQRPADYVAPMR